MEGNYFKKLSIHRRKGNAWNKLYIDSFKQKNVFENYYKNTLLYIIKSLKKKRKTFAHKRLFVNQLLKYKHLI